MKVSGLMADLERDNEPERDGASGRQAVLLWLAASLAGWLLVLGLLSVFF